MRAREILEENYSQSLDSDLNNILIGAKGADAKEINTQDVVKQLFQMGYSVDVNSLLPLLSNNPVVMNATAEIIRFTQPEGDFIGQDLDKQDSAAQVSDMAQQATEIG